MNIIDPIQITAAMISAGTSISEPSANESAWSGAGVAYSVGDVRIRATTHRRYKCAVAHTSAAAPVPEDDGTRWLDVGPTERFAPFDEYVNTGATATNTLSYVLSPPYFNALALYGLVGAQYAITVRDTSGGAVIYQRTGYLTEDPLGWFEYLFVPVVQRPKLVFHGLPIRPSAELEITISAASGAPVGVGMIVVGDFAPLVSDSAEWGGVQYGATAEPVTYSYIKTADDGTTRIVRRHSGTDMRCTVMLPRQFADQALARLQRVLDKPVAWVATSVPGYDGLNVFGLATSASVSYDSFNTASIQLPIKGFI